MCRCWSEEPPQRPQFDETEGLLEEVLRQSTTATTTEVKVNERLTLDNKRGEGANVGGPEKTGTNRKDTMSLPLVRN